MGEPVASPTPPSVVAGATPVKLVSEWLARPTASRGELPASPLTKADAQAVLDLLWADKKASVAKDFQAANKRHSLPLQGKTLKWLERVFGTEPSGGRSLWISLHGGGNAPAELNDEQWQNQIGLYEPKEGIVIAPRAPTNTWNLWHEAHIDPMFDSLIAGMVATRNVNPNKVYVLGYSAGGDGVYQIGPRMADRWAAAAMMAGHPNEAKPLSLRNLPFFIFAGGADDGFDRNKVAATWGKQLDALRAKDPLGYPHKTTIYPGLPHWMDGKDAEAIPLMAKAVRNPWPKKIVWLQDDITHDRFYWLARPTGTSAKDQLVQATVNGQTIDISAEGHGKLILRLSDRLLDLDKPVTVTCRGKKLFSGPVQRSAEALKKSLDERPDPESAASTLLEVLF